MTTLAIATCTLLQHTGGFSNWSFSPDTCTGYITLLSTLWFYMNPANLEPDTRFKKVIIFTVLMGVNAWFMLRTLSLPSATKVSNEENLFCSSKHGFPKAGWKHTLFGSHVQILSGSAIVMGCSIVFRLVIWSIDWTQSQLSVNLCREAEDTVSLRRKEG